ncbi:NADPH-dependent FMN reductase [Parafilimonas sp.]|uniref:NADPH-dependent FMN reductase n=1 Tax=Parafilimonas sp. TaxID=1969739 RepID=UPI0039E2C425
MQSKKNIFAIIGSAGKNSSNVKLVQKIAALTSDVFTINIFEGLSTLPHFDPALSIENTPQIIVDLRNAIQQADGVIICTPEYVFSIPAGLKNAIEWCVSTTVFSKKPVGLITASASGLKGHEELKLIMQTIETIFTGETTLLVHGIKGKVDAHGNITDKATNDAIQNFATAFAKLVDDVADKYQA